MRLRTLLTISLLVWTSTLSELSAQWRYRLQVEVTDALGNPVPARSITLSGEKSSMRLEQSKVIDLDYGKYTIQVEVPGFAMTTAPVVVDQPAQVIAIAMKLGTAENAEPPPCSIIGSVPPQFKALRMRVVQLFGTYLTDVPLDAQQRFQVRNLSCGDYLLIAMQASKLLGTMVVKATVLPSAFEMKLTRPDE